jgi:hypothetical protein
MSTGINQRDIDLLHHNPNLLILELQDLIDIIIYKFVKSRKFNNDEHQDIKQQINIALLNKVENIQKQYQGKSLLRTYFNVIIRNICNDILRHTKKSMYLYDENELKAEEGYEGIDPLILEEEMMRLRKIVDLYYSQKYKLVLCLKLKYKLAISNEDFKNVHKNINRKEINKFMDFIEPYSECTDQKIFEGLTYVLNKFEHKRNTPDSLRKWIFDKINEIIDILNGDPPTSNYDKETLQILFEKCYYKEYTIKPGNIQTEV